MGLPPSTAFWLRPNHDPHLGTKNEGAEATRPPLSYIISVMRDCLHKAHNFATIMLNRGS